ncbi:hypothetical protein I0C86_41200 [Plantactinospora sp. S1510]|uniref:Uncharacterized protein n=1 Tax=Plantactinospora alkalitolerans TaxID=2789879 RepID=A0ABS0HA18_9ACTN|nr:hypothetical protein [Plantactinospora alkalitolerans]MBF9135270.1 hypothetical protein [Plantactinospora alkalitolerans]
MARINAFGAVEPMRVRFDASEVNIIAQVFTTYAALVAVFGEPDQRIDGKPDVHAGWQIYTPFDSVVVFDFMADGRRQSGWWHDEHPDEAIPYSISGHLEGAPHAFAVVVLALARAGQPVEVTAGRAGITY